MDVAETLSSCTIIREPWRVAPPITLVRRVERTRIQGVDQIAHVVRQLPFRKPVPKIVPGAAAPDLDGTVGTSFPWTPFGGQRRFALAINYTTKTQYLFRINKGVFNHWNNAAINEYTPDRRRPIPFERMIFLRSPGA